MMSNSLFNAPDPIFNNGQHIPNFDDFIDLDPATKCVKSLITNSFMAVPTISDLDQFEVISDVTEPGRANLRARLIARTPQRISGGFTTNLEVTVCGYRINSWRVFDFDSSRIQVVNSSNAVQTGWTLSFSQTNTNAYQIGDTSYSTYIARGREVPQNNMNSTVTVTATKANTEGDFRLHLRTELARQQLNQEYNASRFGGIYLPGYRWLNQINFPQTSFYSEELRVNTDLLWRNVTGGITINGILDFGKATSGVMASDFEVIDSTGAAQVGWTIIVNGDRNGSVSADDNINVSAYTNSMATGTGLHRSAQYAIQLKARSVRYDSLPKPNIAYPSLYVAADGRKPLTAGMSVVRIVRDGNIDASNIIHGSSVVISLTINEHIGRYPTASDFDIPTGFTISSICAPRPLPPADTANHWYITLRTPTNSFGSNFITLLANSLGGGFGANRAGPYDDVDSPTFYYDTTGQGVFFGTLTYCSTSNKISARVSFGNNVTLSDISVSDFEIVDSNGIAQSTGTTGTSVWIFDSVPSSATNNITLSAVAPINTNAMFAFRAKQNSLRRADASTNTVPVLAVTSTYVQVTSANAALQWSMIEGGTELSGRLTINSNSVTQMDSSDFEVRTQTNGSTSNWTISVADSSGTDVTTSTSIAAGSYVTVRAHPPAGTDDLFKLRIKEDSIRLAGSSTNNFPSANTDSITANVNNNEIVSVSSFNAPTSTSTQPIREVVSTFRLTLDRAVPTRQISLSDFTPAASVRFDAVNPINESSGSASIYDLTVINPTEANGSYTITFNMNSIDTGTGYRGGPTINQVSTVVYYDTRSFTTWGTPSFCGTENTVTTTLTFAESVTGLTSSDIIVRNQCDTQTISGWTHTISGSGSSYTVTSTPASRTNNIFILRLLPDSIMFRGQEGPINNEDTDQFNVDNRLTGGDEVAIFWSNMVGGPTITGRLTFSGQSVSGISANSFQLRTVLGVVRNVTITPSATDAAAGQSITVTVTPHSAFKVDGEFFIRLGQGTITSNNNAAPNNNVDSDLVELNNFTVWNSITGGRNLVGVMLFGSDLRNIATSDYEVIDETDVVQTGWTITFTPDGTTSRTNGQTLIVTATPPSNTADVFRLRLRATSLRTATGSRDTVPKVAVISERARVNNLSTGNPYLEITNLPSTSVTSTTLRLNINALLNGQLQNIDDLRPADITITGPNGSIPVTITAR